MTTDERRRPAVGAQIKRWRTERAMTLANVAERSGLNVGYLSQIENDKASPSLSCLASIGDALDVPIAWFFIEELPAPDRGPSLGAAGVRDGLGRIEHVDGARHPRPRDHRGEPRRPGAASACTAMRATSITSSCAAAGGCRQGDHVVEVGPGDYVRWDGTIPHDAEVIGVDDGASMLILRIRPKD